MAEPKYWMGDDPTNCDIDGREITVVFFDAATTQGPWANMCPLCYVEHGVGLGTGKGQRYERQSDGRWLKTGG